MAEDGRFCWRCGRPRASGAAETTPRLSERHAPEIPFPATERCQITFSRRLGAGQFYAFGVAQRQGAPIVVGRSPAFRALLRREPVRRGGARRAHRALVEQLQREGWENYGSASSWYSTWLRR